MKESELRIGNFVLYKGTPTQISGIISPYPPENLDLSEKWSVEINPSDGFRVTLDEISPIPLTEEWLISLGFSSDGYKKGYLGIDHRAGGFITDFVLAYPGVIGEFQTSFSYELNGWKYASLESVHDLQNLFFALIGEDLKMKTP